jgi:hypothetical protein
MDALMPPSTSDVPVRPADWFRFLGFTDGVELEALSRHWSMPAGPEPAMRAWFTAALGDAVGAGEDPLAVGRAAFVLVDGARRWPGALLAEPAPELAAALRRAARLAAPRPAPLPMPVQRLERPRPSGLVRRLRPA